MADQRFELRSLDPNYKRKFTVIVGSDTGITSEQQLNLFPLWRTWIDNLRYTLSNQHEIDAYRKHPFLLREIRVLILQQDENGYPRMDAEVDFIRKRNVGFEQGYYKLSDSEPSIHNFLAHIVEPIHAFLIILRDRKAPLDSEEDEWAILAVGPGLNELAPSVECSSLPVARYPNKTLEKSKVGEKFRALKLPKLDTEPFNMSHEISTNSDLQARLSSSESTLFKEMNKSTVFHLYHKNVETFEICRAVIDKDPEYMAVPLLTKNFRRLCEDDPRSMTALAMYRASLGDRRIHTQ